MPVKIQRYRIDTSIYYFYEDLKNYCKTMNWNYIHPTDFPSDLKSEDIN